MLNFFELRQWLARYPLRWRVGGDQIGVLLFQDIQFMLQRIQRGGRNIFLIMDMIARAMMVYGLTQFSHALTRVAFRDGRFHDILQAMNAHRFLVIVSIVALLGLTGYAGWTLREPIKAGWKTAAGLRPSSGFTFVVVGDNHGVNDVYRQIIKEVGADDHAFLLNLADTSNLGTKAEFTAVKELESNLPFPAYHVLGSHDIKTDPTGSLFQQVFERQPCSSFTYRQLHVITLDNAERKVGFPDACLDWLVKDLDAHPSEPTIISYHRPFNLPLAQLLGDDETRASRQTNDRFLEILAGRTNIKYIFTAHVHTYIPYALNGIPAVVSGGGGDPAQLVLGGAKNNFFHYLVVRVTGSSVTTEMHRVQLTD